MFSIYSTVEKKKGPLAISSLHQQEQGLGYIKIKPFEQSRKGRPLLLQN
jgi:hypothetical protein